MKTIDITGTIHTGMWRYDAPFPTYELVPIPQPDWLEYPIYMEEFRGMCSQTGTYLETPAHFVGYEKSYPLIELPVEQMVDMRCFVFQLDHAQLERQDDRAVIRLDDLKRHADTALLEQSEAIVVATGWGAHWDAPGFIERSPFFRKEAMEWLIDFGPRIIASDSPRWENLEHPEGFFPSFYGAGMLMLAPIVLVEEVPSRAARLTALPAKIANTCAAPTRAVLKFE